MTNLNRAAVDAAYNDDLAVYRSACQNAAVEFFETLLRDPECPNNVDMFIDWGIQRAHRAWRHDDCLTAEGFGHVVDMILCH